jgi:hypothetical protein
VGVFLLLFVFDFLLFDLVFVLFLLLLLLFLHLYKVQFTKHTQQSLTSSLRSIPLHHIIQPIIQRPNIIHQHNIRPSTHPLIILLHRRLIREYPRPIEQIRCLAWLRVLPPPMKVVEVPFAVDHALAGSFVVEVPEAFELAGVEGVEGFGFYAGEVLFVVVYEAEDFDLLEF